MMISHAEEDDVSALAGKIIECSWDPERKCWVCMRLRPDKANPNELNTYKKVGYALCFVFLPYLKLKMVGYISTGNIPYEYSINRRL